MQKRADGSVVKQSELLCFMKNHRELSFMCGLWKERSGGAFLSIHNITNLLLLIHS